MSNNTASTIVLVMLFLSLSSCWISSDWRAVEELRIRSAQGVRP